MDLLVQDESPAQISDKIKDILYARSAEKIDEFRPQVAASLFDQDVNLDGEEGEEAMDDVDLDDEAEE